MSPEIIFYILIIVHNRRINKLDTYICITCKIHICLYSEIITNYLDFMSGYSLMPMLVRVPAGRRGHTHIRITGENLLRTYLQR